MVEPGGGTSVGGAGSRLQECAAGACCCVCLKAAGEARLVARGATAQDFFAALQIPALTPWLCLWCSGKLRSFQQLRQKAQRAQYILTLLGNFGLDTVTLLEDSKFVEEEIQQLKKEPYTIKIMCATELTPPEPELVEVKEEKSEPESRKIKTNRKRKEAEEKIIESVRVEIKMDAVVDDDDSWDMMPLKQLKEEDKRISSSIHEDGIGSGDDVCLEIVTVSEFSVNPPKKVKPAKIKNHVVRKARSIKENRSKKKEHGLVDGTQPSDPKTPDINAAVEDLDNESYIVSEEVHQHVETISMSEADQNKQKLFRMKKLSYQRAEHKCEACVLGFATQDEYHDHMKNHYPSAGAHRCHGCDMYFEKHRELEKHVQSHSRSHRCRLCEHASTDYRAAVKHYISQHSRVKFTCMHCNKEFRRPINLKKHLQKAHAREAESGCAVCGEEFLQEERLKAHMQTHKPEDISWHECPICKKKSRNKYNMNRHIEAHDKESLPIVCNICQKTFKTSVLLAAHVQRLHTPNSKKFQCDECGKFFYDKGELRTHVQWTHKREGGVDCPRCPKKFRTAYLLNHHVQTVHENIPKPKDKLCDFCGRGFSSRKTLKSHRYIHTGERPYSCPDCGQTFRQRCAMRLHYKSKHLNIRWKDLVGKKKQTVQGGGVTTGMRRAYGVGAAREFCCVCLKLPVEAALRLAPPRCVALHAALQLGQASRWVCCWCSAKLRVFSELRSRVLRSHRWLEHAATPTPSSRQDTTLLLTELEEIKKENYQIQLVHLSDSNSSEEVIEIKRDKEASKESNDGYANDVDSNVNPLSDEADDFHIEFESKVNEMAPNVCIFEGSDVNEDHRFKKKESVKDKSQKVSKSNKTNLDDSTHFNWEAVYSKTSEEALKHITLVHLTEEDYHKEHEISLTMKRYVNCQFKCQKCAVGHRFKDLHEAHMRLHDPTSGPHHCGTCDQYLKSQRALSKHVAQHFRRYRCAPCGRLEAARGRAVDHYAAEHARLDARCPWCGRSFRKRPMYLKRHIERVHSGGRAHHCHLCSKTFREPAALKHHMRPCEAERHACPTCASSFASARGLAAHAREHALAAPGLCLLCLRVFASGQLLRRHSRAKHGDAAQSYECHDCGKRYGVKSHLRDHLVWQHSSRAGHQCARCPKKFRQKSVLRRHVKYVHDKTVRVKNKLCDLCGTGFSTRSLLDQHRLIHTGERPHACGECGQTFRQKSAMQTHVKLKHRKTKEGAVGETGNRGWHN